MNGVDQDKFQSSRPSRLARAFWTLNKEMTPANKATFVREIDATSLVRLRQHALENAAEKPSYTALVIKASAIALREYPYANQAILGLPLMKKLVQFNNMDITVAIERDVPQAKAIVLADTIHAVDSKSPGEISAELRQIAESDLDSNERWRLFFNLLDKLPPFISRWIIGIPKYSAKQWATHRGNACFVNSPAKYGVDFFIADMIWPLTVTFGWIKDRPIAVEGRVEVRTTMPLSIIFDRRIMAGAPAARFFNRLAEILENAEQELQETVRSE